MGRTGKHTRERHRVFPGRARIHRSPRTAAAPRLPTQDPVVRTRVLVPLLAVLAVVVPTAAAAAPPPPPATPAPWVAPVDGTLEVTRLFEPPPGPYAAGHRGVE